MNVVDDFDWPSLRTYAGEHLSRIALPLGGIGTGTISLGGRGDLRDWELVNRPAKGFAPANAFFALWTRATDGATSTRCLQGPIDLARYEGSDGAAVPQHNLPRFRECEFKAAYPLGQVTLSDPGVPVQARLQAFNPFVPNDAEASGHPVAVLRWTLRNRTDAPLEAALCLSAQNFIGSDGTQGEATGNRNQRRDAGAVRGLWLSSEGVAADAPAWGNLAMAALDAPDDISVRTAWNNENWSGLLDFWDDFSLDGRLDERSGEGQKAPTASLCVPLRLEPHGEASVTFLLAWHFPHRLSWTPNGQGIWEASGPGGSNAAGPPVIGNFYTTQSADAWDALTRFANQLPELEAQTVAFAHAFYGSDLPDEVKEAAGFNLSTLRSPTCFRTPDGRFFGWEGVHDRFGSCFGSCTHVWNYESATAFLFPDLSRSMREVEFEHATDKRGHMRFRVGLPLHEYALSAWALAAADGQMGCLVKLLREWRLSGDGQWLQRMWPHARRALEFCWIEGGWDADCDGVMEGCQHNTMDVEYYGPNPQMQGWYLGALRAGEEMARFVGEAEFAHRCRELFERGSRWTDAHLWNGDYYEHHIQPPQTAPAEGLSMSGHFPDPDPLQQLGAGCLVDQLVGVHLATLAGLDGVLDDAHVRATLHSILRFNRREEWWDHFNPLRSFVLGDEAALVMASYPRGNRPRVPFPYFAEAMTGFEYAVAAHLMQVGDREEGLRVVKNIRARYDGRKRNPFNEAECGYHYARALASWNCLVAFTGFIWDARSATLSFRASESPARWFWSGGGAWGTFEQAPEGQGTRVKVSILRGELTIRRLILRAATGQTTTHHWPEPQRATCEGPLEAQLEKN